MKNIVYLLVLFPSIALSWGDTGHKVVCELALEELTPAARAEVDRLLELDPDFDTFAESCLFADIEPKVRPLEHFINVPRDARAIVKDDCPMADLCLFTAIKDDSVILASTSNTDTARLEALKLLGHWVGDLHQPLHVSYGDDRGANDIGVQPESCGENLHSTWDNCIIDGNTGADYLQISTRLGSEITDNERSLWEFDSPSEWANESYQISISPTVKYCTLQQGACWYSAHNMMLDDGEVERDIMVPGSYISTHRETVDLRLKQAGVRLGALLNRLLLARE